MNLCRLLLPLTLAALTGLAVPARAEAPVYTLAGSGSGYVDVRFPSLTHVSAENFTARTSGSYAGYLVQDLSDGAIRIGAVHIPRLSDIGDDIARITPEGTAQVALPAGRYRLHLLTDGTSTVRIKTLGGSGRNQSLRIRRRAGVTARVLDLGDVNVATRRVGIDNAGTTFAYLYIEQYSTATVGATVAACVVATDTAGCPPLGATLAVLNVESVVADMEVATPSDLPDGRSYGVVEVMGAGALPDTVAFYLTLDTRI